MIDIGQDRSPHTSKLRFFGPKDTSTFWSKSFNLWCPKMCE